MTVDKDSARRMWWICLVVFVNIILVMTARLFLFDVFVVRGNSMLTTLSDGDYVFAKKTGVDHISRGDIVAVYDMDSREMIVKRVIGLPGEHVVVDDSGLIYVNGQLVDDEYQHATIGLTFGYGDVQLDDDSYYVVGDNRYDSYDSRYFGPVSQVQIRDITLFRVFPFRLL